MKNLIIASLFMITCALLPSNNMHAFTLQDAVLAQNMPKGINMMVPAKDGKSYYELSDDGSRILGIRRLEGITYRNEKRGCFYGHPHLLFIFLP